MLMSGPACLARFVENSSVVTARGVRATAAMLTPWRLAWWTAARTQWLSAWTTSRAAAAEISASTSIPPLTCRLGSRLRSIKPVKTLRPQPWWVLNTVRVANNEHSFCCFYQLSAVFLWYAEQESRCKPMLTFLKVTNKHSPYLFNKTLSLKQLKIILDIVYWCNEMIRVSQYPPTSLKFDNAAWGLFFFMNICYCACVWACTLSV